MFEKASSFNQDIENCGLSSESYDLTLKGWTEIPNVPTGRNLEAIDLNFAISAQHYRDMLANNKSRTSSHADPIVFINHTGAFITVWDTHKIQSGTFAISSEGTNYEY